MNYRIWFFAALMGCLILCVVGGAQRLFSPNRGSDKKEQKIESAPTAPVPGTQTSSTSPGAASQPAYDPNVVRQGLETIFDELKKKGAIVEVPPIEKTLHDAVASGDKGQILRAFHDAIYSRGSKMSEAIPAIKAYLNDPNPYVRLNAGQDLLIVGDQSGFSTLLALVQSPQAINGIGQDVRIAAAMTLAQFRQTDATQAIYNLYQQTQNGQVIEALQTLAPNQVGTLIPPKDYYNEVMAIQDYGIEHDQQFLPQITTTFQNQTQPDLKLAAAWALATMTGNQNAVNYLVQASQTEIAATTGGAYESALKYLGNIQTPQAKQTLEAALKASNTSAVQIAAVNLVFNQGGSEKVNQLVVDELNGQTTRLGAETTLNLATQLSDDPAIQAAGQAYAEREGLGTWQLYTVERKNWPIYNWIGNYVVKLNK